MQDKLLRKRKGTLGARLQWFPVNGDLAPLLWACGSAGECDSSGGCIPRGCWKQCRKCLEFDQYGFQGHAPHDLTSSCWALWPGNFALSQQCHKSGDQYMGFGGIPSPLVLVLVVCVCICVSVYTCTWTHGSCITCCKTWVAWSPPTFWDREEWLTRIFCP